MSATSTQRCQLQLLVLSVLILFSVMHMTTSFVIKPLSSRITWRHIVRSKRLPAVVLHATLAGTTNLLKESLTAIPTPDEPVILRTRDMSKKTMIISIAVDGEKTQKAFGDACRLLNEVKLQHSRSFSCLF